MQITRTLSSEVKTISSEIITLTAEQASIVFGLGPKWPGK